MTRRPSRLAVLVLLCSPVVWSGCVIAADALSPDLFVQLGFDPNTIFPQRGTVIVNFTNNTQFAAFFAAFESVDAADLTIDSRNFSLLIDPMDTRNEVLDCPVDLVSPGFLDAMFAAQNDAVTVFAGDGAGTAVMYDGSPLVAGRDFACGDVINVQLDQIGAGGDAGQVGFVLTVLVIPGR